MRMQLNISGLTVKCQISNNFFYQVQELNKKAGQLALPGFITLTV
jgi:hypothetical protein